MEDRGDFLQLEREDFQTGPYGLKNAAKDLAAIAGPKDAFQILKRFAAQDFRRVAVFVLRGDLAVGWHQVGCSLPEADFRKVSFPIADSRLLHQAASSGASFVGRVPSSKVDNWLGSLLGLSKREVFTLPIRVNDQGVGIMLACEPAQGTLEDRSHVYNTLAAKMSHAIQMAYLRKRILDE
jgi:hypothetical protein